MDKKKKNKRHSQNSFFLMNYSKKNRKNKNYLHTISQW